MENELKSNKKLGKLAMEKGIRTWNELLFYITQLPYGRNSIRTDFSLVMTEEKGTCSSKHAFLKAIAEENNMVSVKLMLCVYKMTESNTPGIGTILSENGIEYIPEAHCYLIVDGNKFDFTSEESELTNIEPDIIETFEINPEQSGNYKVEYHKEYIRNWVNQMETSFSFDEIWSIREKCIAKLSKTRNVTSG